jgi:hypothetical protein
LLLGSLRHRVATGVHTRTPFTIFGQARCVVLVWRFCLDLGGRFAIIVCRMLTRVFLLYRGFALGVFRHHGLGWEYRISFDHGGRFAIIVYIDPTCVVIQTVSIVKRFSRVVLVFLLLYRRCALGVFWHHKLVTDTRILYPRACVVITFRRVRRRKIKRHHGENKECSAVVCSAVCCVDT